MKNLLQKEQKIRKNQLKETRTQQDKRSQRQLTCSHHSPQRKQATAPAKEPWPDVLMC